MTLETCGDVVLMKRTVGRPFPFILSHPFLHHEEISLVELSACSASPALALCFLQRGPGSGSTPLALDGMQLQCNYSFHGYLLFLASEVSFPFMVGL